MGEACIRRWRVAVWLCNCDLGEKCLSSLHQLSTLLVTNCWTNVRSRAQGCSKVGSSFSGDIAIDVGVGKELLCLRQVGLFCDEPCMFSRSSESSHLMALIQTRHSTRSEGVQSVRRQRHHPRTTTEGLTLGAS